MIMIMRVVYQWVTGHSPSHLQSIPALHSSDHKLLLLFALPQLPHLNDPVCGLAKMGKGENREGEMGLIWMIPLAPPPSILSLK